MAIAVKKIPIWRGEMEHTAGALNQVLEPLADAGADFKVVMGYRFPGRPTHAAVEVYPIVGEAATAAARRAGMSLASIPALQVEGRDEPGLGRRMTSRMAAAGISIDFLMAQVIDGKFSAIFGFENETDAEKAAGLLQEL